MNKTFLKVFSKANVLVYRLTNGRVWGGLKSSPVCLVTMKGRKTGKTRTIPLMYVPYGDQVVLVASLAGAPEHPVWYHNLMAHPHVTIQAGSAKQDMDVRQSSPEEKAEIWPHAVAAYGDFADYQERTDRDIPVLICTPAGG